MVRDMNFTLSVDERVVAEARKIACVRGTSLNQLVCEYLSELTGLQVPQRILSELDSLWEESAFKSSESWMRHELHERS